MCTLLLCLCAAVGCSATALYSGLVGADHGWDRGTLGLIQGVHGDGTVGQTHGCPLPGQRVFHPLPVVSFGMVFWSVCSTTLLPRQGPLDGLSSIDHQVLQFQGVH